MKTEERNAEGRERDARSIKGRNKDAGSRANRKRKADGMKRKTTAGIAALVAAVALFAILLGTEKSMMEQYEKGTVYVAACEIPKGLLITEENVGKYFKKTELEKRSIPPTALADPGQIRGLAAIFDVEAGTILTKGMFVSLEEILRVLEEPVIAGFRADDMYQVAGGVLRTGDRIHIYTIRDNQAKLAWEAVYVQQVFDSAGKSISNEDQVSVAQRINVYLDKKDVEAFYSGLAMGNLRVVKVLE